MKHFEKNHRDFPTKLAYHEYLKEGLYRILKEKMPDVEFVKEYPPSEPSGIDIVGLKQVLGKKIEIIAVEVLGIAEERVLSERDFLGFKRKNNDGYFQIAFQKQRPDKGSGFLYNSSQR